MVWKASRQQCSSGNQGVMEKGKIIFFSLIFRGSEKFVGKEGDTWIEMAGFHISGVEFHSASSASFIETLLGPLWKAWQSTSASRYVCAAYTRDHLTVQLL